MKKILLLISGCILIVVGAIGVIVPFLPTTPLILLAGVCFSFSSEKAYRFLLKSRIFGPYIENYKTKQGVSVAAKVRGIVMLWLLAILSMIVMYKVWFIIMMAAIAIGVTIHLLLLKTKKEEGPTKTKALE